MNVQLTDKIEAIYLSTMELIHENGFHGAPISCIAKSANVSVGTVYHYFESKEDLIVKLFQYCKSKFKDVVFDGMTDETPYELRFKTVWKRFFAFYVQHPILFRFMEQYYSSPFHELERIRKEKVKGDDKDIYHLMEEGRRQGHLKQLDGHLLTSAFAGVAVSMVRTKIFGNVQIDDHQVDEMVEIVWNSIKATD